MGEEMTDKSYEMSGDITNLSGMVTWIGGDGVWHSEMFEFLTDARDAFRGHAASPWNRSAGPWASGAGPPRRPGGIARTTS